MSKPVVNVVLAAAEVKVRVKAVLDTGSFYTILREDLPQGRVTVTPYPSLQLLGTAAKGGKLRVAGTVFLDLLIAGKRINTSAFVSPDLKKDLIVGAGTMQMWDISIVNRNGSTRVVVGRDMRDPDITEVDVARRRA